MGAFQTTLTVKIFVDVIGANPNTALSLAKRKLFDIFDDHQLEEEGVSLDEIQGAVITGEETT